MGLIAGVLVPITTHNIRAGGAKDIAHLPQELKGAPNSVSMKALGHSRSSFASGVTDVYVPDLDVSTNAAKALAPFIDRRAPQLAAEPFQPSRPGKRRQPAYLAELGLDPATPHTAKKIARLEHDRWVQQQKDAPKEKRPTRQRQALRQRTSSENNALARPTSPTLGPRPLRPGSTEEGGSEEALERFLEDVDQDPFGDCPPQPVEDPNILRHPMDNDRHIPSFLTPSDIIEEQDHPLGQTESQYPPLEDLEFTTVNDPDLQSLQDIIAGVHSQEEEQTDGSANEGHAAQSVATIVNNVNVSTFDENAAIANDRLTRELMETQLCSVEGYPQLLLPPHEFVTFLSEINVVRNFSLASGPQTSWKERAPQYVDVGNSRSPLEPFVFVCPNTIYGCDYTSYRLSSVMDRHLYRCPKQPVAVAHAAGTISDSEAFESNQESKPAQQRFVCDRDKCDKSYTSQSNLTQHIKNTHDWIKKCCDRAGCTDKTEFKTGGEYFAHIRLRHDDMYEPTTCRIPPCDEREKPFVATSRESQRSHLANTHHFTKDKIKTILPPIVKKTRAKPTGLTGGAGWGVRPCPVLGCKAKSAMAVTNMRAHLQGKSTPHDPRRSQRNNG